MQAYFQQAGLLHLRRRRRQSLRLSLVLNPLMHLQKWSGRVSLSRRRLLPLFVSHPGSSIVISACRRRRRVLESLLDGLHVPFTRQCKFGGKVDGPSRGRRICRGKPLCLFQETNR